MFTKFLHSGFRVNLHVLASIDCPIVKFIRLIFNSSLKEAYLTDRKLPGLKADSFEPFLLSNVPFLVEDLLTTANDFVECVCEAWPASLGFKREVGWLSPPALSGTLKNGKHERSSYDSWA